MTSCLPSDVVTTIKSFFPYIEKNGALYVKTSEIYAIKAILELIDHVPDHLIKMSGINYAVFISCKAILHKATSVEIPKGSVFTLSELPFDGYKEANALSALFRLLRQCPDESVPETIDTISFISDESAREIARLDLASAEHAFDSGNWKGATVLAGSVIEALLLWAIKQAPSTDYQNALSAFPSPPRSPLDNWGLGNLIFMADKLGFLSQTTVTQANLSQGFRNLIHPGRILRTKEECNRSTAMAALAAVGFVIDDLSLQFASPS